MQLYQLHENKNLLHINITKNMYYGKVNTRINVN
jgi:hypothetical protein